MLHGRVLRRLPPLAAVAAVLLTLFAFGPVNADAYAYASIYYPGSLVDGTHLTGQFITQPGTTVSFALTTGTVSASSLFCVFFYDGGALNTQYNDSGISGCHHYSGGPNGWNYASVAGGSSHFEVLLETTTASDFAGSVAYIPPPAPGATPPVTGLGFPVITESFVGSSIVEGTEYLQGPLDPGVGFPQCGRGSGSAPENVAVDGMARATESCHWRSVVNVGGTYEVGELFNRDFNSPRAFRNEYASDSSIGGLQAGTNPLVSALLPIPAGTVVLAAAVNGQLRPDGSGVAAAADGTALNVTVTIYDGAGAVLGTFESTSGQTYKIISGSEGAAGTTAVDVTVPAGAVSYQVRAAWAATSALPSTGSGTQTAYDFNEVSAYFADAADQGTLTSSGQCGASGQPACAVTGGPTPGNGYTGSGGGSVVGGSSCGPLSGDCSKAMLPIPTCSGVTAPQGDFNPVDWIGYIVSVIFNVPCVIWSFIVTGFDAIIDLIEPGAGLGSAWQNFVTTIGGKAPFGWVTQISSALSAGLVSPDAGAFSLCTDFPISHTGTTHVCVPDPTPILSPYRGIMAAMVYLGLGFALLRIIRSAVGQGGGGGEE